MDSASVISLSSASSKDSSESLVSILSVSSETQRVPVSWENKKDRRKLKTALLQEKTPDHSEKVNKWMNCCEYKSEKCVSPENNRENQKSTCIRYDFDKSPRAATIPKSCFTRTTPLFSYMEEAKRNNNQNKISRGLLVNNDDSHKINGNNLSKKQEGDTPLSPNSHKKELCSYLQLIKPEDESNAFFIEHRRSGRVKNLMQNTDKSKATIAKSKENKDLNKNEKIHYPTLKSIKELKMKTSKLGKIFNLKRKKSDKEEPNSYLPLPPKKMYKEISNFDDVIKEFVDRELEEKEKKILKDESEQKNNIHVKNGCMKKVEKRRKFTFGLKKYKKGNFINKRIISLRSKGRLRNISLDTSVLKKKKKKNRKKTLKETKANQHGTEELDSPKSEILTSNKNLETVKSKEKNTNTENIKGEILNIPKSLDKNIDINKKSLTPVNSESSRCEIISVHTNSDDENVDLKNFIDDMLELDKMSEEHRKNVIESRILASSSITNLLSKISPQEAKVQKALKIFSEISEQKHSEEKENHTQSDVVNDKNDQEDVQIESSKEEIQVDENLNKNSTEVKKVEVTDLIVSEHDYCNVEMEIITAEEEEDDDEDCDEDDENDTQSLRNGLSPTPVQNLKILPVNQGTRIESLHRSLNFVKRKLNLNRNGLYNWTLNANSDRKLNHSITISKKNGDVLRACYQEYNLVIVQQSSVSFWTQSALGNVLGAQNMWIPKGQIQRIPLNSTYRQKNAMEMVITSETSIAYVELWTKEHKSEVREVPVADVFATVYFWRVRQSGLDKKALQLENIKGFSDSVQYCVLKSYPRIVVSWHHIQGSEKRTKIHSYHLAADFQTVANISEIQPVEHQVSSLHNIEDCDSLVMGCGENKITLWNIEYGYIVATIEMSSIKSPLSTLWVKCDKGFLFIMQECVDQELRLIAINGMNHSWKKLQSYNPSPDFDCLRGACIENGILVAYYSKGILCWNAQTGELIVEELPKLGEYIPSGRHVIMLVNDNIIVKHSLSHLITDL